MIRSLIAAGALLAVAAAWWLVGCARRPPATGAADAWAFALVANDGTPTPLDAWRGRPLLIVNTASRCGFTAQYAGLQALHERYAARGLVVIGVPANDFLWQEPGDDAAIRSFCDARFGVSFPLMAKVRVTGAGQHPLYRWLTGESARPGAIRWNFTKFLVGRDGRVAERFGPKIDPLDPAVIAAIEAALAP